MTTKIDGSAGIEFPDSTDQNTAADVVPAFSVYQTVGTSYGIGYTKVGFDTELWDTNNAFTDSHFQPTVAGYYQLNGTVHISNVAAPIEAAVALYKNGEVFKTSADWMIGGLDILLFQHSISGMIYLNGTTDYVELYMYSTKVGTTAAGYNNTWFDGFLARRA